MCIVTSHKEDLSGKKWSLVDCRQCTLLPGQEEKKEEVNKENNEIK
jgi:hypothetical protein